MRFTTETAIAILAFTNVAIADAPSPRWTGSLSARANTLGRRQLEIGGLKLGGGNATAGVAGGERNRGGNGGGLTIGGLTLGGAGGGIAGNGLSLPGGQNNGQVQQGQVAQESTPALKEGGNASEAAGAESGKPVTPATETVTDEARPVESVAPAASEPANGEAKETAKDGKSPANEATVSTPPEPLTGAGPGTADQPGRAEGEAAAADAKSEAAKAKGEAGAAEGKSNGVKATEESERFSEEAGITLNQDGSAANLGGNLGITAGSDGSRSVGGENGINIASNGEATIAGNERE